MTLVYNLPTMLRSVMAPVVPWVADSVVLLIRKTHVITETQNSSLSSAGDSLLIKPSHSLATTPMYQPRSTIGWIANACQQESLVDLEGLPNEYVPHACTHQVRHIDLRDQSSRHSAHFASFPVHASVLQR